MTPLPQICLECDKPINDKESLLLCENCRVKESDEQDERSSRRKYDTISRII